MERFTAFDRLPVAIIRYFAYVIIEKSVAGGLKYSGNNLCGRTYKWKIENLRH